MAREYSNEIVNTLKQFFQEDDWHYDFIAERGIFQLGVNLKCELNTLHYFIDVHDDHYIVYARPDLKGNTEKPKVMAELAEFICRANYGLKYGCFELDCNDGELRYRYSVDCADTLPGFRTMRGSLVIPALTFEKYCDGLLAVMLVGIPAKQAIDLSEKQ